MRKHVATLELTPAASVSDIQFLLDETIEKAGIETESNQDGTYDIYMVNIQ